MRTPFQTRIYQSEETVSRSPAPAVSGRPGPYLFLFVLLIIGTLVWMAHKDFLDEKDGQAVLDPWRAAKMLKELKDMEYGGMCYWPGCRVFIRVITAREIHKFI